MVNQFADKSPKEKQYDPAGQNEQSPAEGMAAVNTFHPEEESQQLMRERENNTPKPATTTQEEEG